jgi:hypothetical protein
VVVGVGDIGYPQPLRLLPAGAQGARPLSPNGCPSSSSLARALLRNTPYTLSPAQPTRAANANSRRSSIYRPRPKHTWHLIYAIWFQAVDAKGGLGSYDLACIDTTARGLTLWKLTDAIFAVTILYGIISQYPSVSKRIQAYIQAYISKRISKRIQA